MPLEKYLGLGEIELLARKVESSMYIFLKAILCWLMNEDRLKE